MPEPTGADHPRRREYHKEWYTSTMQTAIDTAGRLVIPKAIRDRLGLTGGQVVEIQERDGKIEIEAAPTPMTLVDREGGLVAVPEEDLPPLTDDIVRTTIERTRR